MNQNKTIDFYSGIFDWGNYSGSERKKKYVFEGITYMVKFPDPVREIHNLLSYMNNQYSEYVGCHIYESLNIPVQETYLGKYVNNGREIVAVACRDFKNDGLELYPLKYIQSGDISSSSDFLGNLTITKLYEVIHSLGNAELESKTINHFWTMFIVDYLIGNYDRHLENWGMAIDQNGRRMPSPVYDCGSSLLPLYSDDELEVLVKQKLFNGICLNVNTPFFDEVTGRRVIFREVFESPNQDLKKAILEVFPKISLAKIYQIIQETPFMSDVRKTAMIESMKIRYNQVLLKSFVQIKYPELSSHEQSRLISSMKSNSSASLREVGYTPQIRNKSFSHER